MSAKDGKARSVIQRVANRAHERGLTRQDGLVAYAMDRLLYRLGRSAQASEFVLKGGVLVANLVDAPHRFTRDIDLLRRHGPADPDEMRWRFRQVAAVAVDDGITFDAADVRAVEATRELDGYEGVRVTLGLRIGGTTAEVRVDIGFGDAVVPPAERISLVTFLDGDPAASVFAYDVGPVLAEKIETLVAKFPVIEHRLKDLLDVVVLAASAEFLGPDLVASLRATFERRKTDADDRVLDDMREHLRGRKWSGRWSVMRREKTVTATTELTDAVAIFDRFVRPLLAGVRGGDAPPYWPPGGPWGPPGPD